MQTNSKLSNRTYSLKKQLYRNHLKELLKKKYIFLCSVSDLSSNLIHQFRNNLKLNSIPTIKLRSTHLGAFNIPVQKGDKILVFCDTLDQVQYIHKNITDKNYTTNKFLKCSEVIPVDYTIEKGLTDLKAGPAFKKLEAVTSVKLQKNQILIEQPIVFKKGTILDEAHQAVLMLLNKPLKSSTLHLETLLLREDQSSTHIEKPAFVKDYICDPSVLDSTISNLVRSISTEVTPSGNLLVDKRLERIISNLKNHKE